MTLDGVRLVYPVSPCGSAWGPDADRRRKPLVSLGHQGRKRPPSHNHPPGEWNVERCGSTAATSVRCICPRAVRSHLGSRRLPRTARTPCTPMVMAATGRALPGKGNLICPRHRSKVMGPSAGNSTCHSKSRGHRRSRGCPFAGRTFHRACSRPHPAGWGRIRAPAAGHR